MWPCHSHQDVDSHFSCLESELALVVEVVTKSCLTLETPWTTACQALLSMGFPRQEYWSKLLFPSPEDHPNPENKPVSCIAGGFFTNWATREKALVFKVLELDLVVQLKPVRCSRNDETRVLRGQDGRSLTTSSWLPWKNICSLD